MTRSRFACVAAGMAALALSPAIAAARPATGTWTGLTYPDNVSTFTFTVHGSTISHVVDRAIGCYAYPAYQMQTMRFPGSGRISGNGSFQLTWHPVEGATDTFTGRVRGHSASGTLTQSGVCDTGTQKWVARPGRTPPKPPKTKFSGCTKVRCTATDGLVFKVTGVDTTLTSMPHQAQPDDPDLGASGGVLVTVVATNATGRPVSFTTPDDWTLQDGSGHRYPARDDGGFSLVTSDGKMRTDSSTCGRQRYSVPARGTSGTVSLCFVYAAGASHKGMHLLFGHPTTLAKFPLQ